MKKVLFLSRYQNSVARGAETFVTELSRYLADDFEIDILTGEDSDNYQKIIYANADWVFPLNGRMQSLKAAIGRIQGKYKLIIAGQSGIGRDDIWNIFVCKPDIFVALTDLMQNWAKQFAWGSKVIKIPNGVDLKKFKPKGDKYNHQLKGKVLLSVGALTWYKHHELTINAVALLEDVSLLIVGKGEEEDNLNKLIKDKRLENRVRIISAPFSELPSIYRSADLFTLPSWDREAFGIVYIEALASGLGVIAPNDLARKEIVGEAGILVDVFNAKEFASAIEKGLEKNWSVVARNQAEKFSWEVVANRYKEIFAG